MTVTSNLIKSHSDFTPKHRTLFHRLLRNFRVYRTIWQPSDFKSLKNKSCESPLALNNIKIGIMGYSTWPHHQIFPQTDQASFRLQFLVLLCLHYCHIQVFPLSSRYQPSDPAFLFLWNWFYTLPLVLPHSMYLENDYFAKVNQLSLLSLHLRDRLSTP